MNNKSQQNEPHKKAVGCTVVLIVFVVLTAIAINSSPDSEPMTPEEEAMSHGTIASVCAQSHVKTLLKSPSTADFPWSSDTTAWGDDQYLVQSYVDSQNGFGAMIRTNYVCTVTVNDPDTFLCDVDCAFE